MRLNKFLDERAGGKTQSASYSAPVGACSADYTDNNLEAFACEQTSGRLANAGRCPCDDGYPFARHHAMLVAQEARFRSASACRRASFRRMKMPSPTSNRTATTTNARLVVVEKRFTWEPRR